MAAAVIVVPIPDAARELSIKMFEAPGLGELIRGVVAEMPLAHHQRLVASAGEVLREDRLLEWQAELLILRNRSVDSQSHRRLPGHQCGTRRTASRLDIESIELDARARDSIDIGRRDLAPVVSDIVPAEVVRQDQQDIRRL